MKLVSVQSLQSLVRRDTGRLPGWRRGYTPAGRICWSKASSTSLLVWRTGSADPPAGHQQTSTGCMLPDARASGWAPNSSTCLALTSTAVLHTGRPKAKQTGRPCLEHSPTNGDLPLGWDRRRRTGRDAFEETTIGLIGGTLSRTDDGPFKSNRTLRAESRKGKDTGFTADGIRMTDERDVPALLTRHGQVRVRTI